ncbi:hypothetical protein [Psychroserpens algicola]|uniref:hypothetical protein n=1 Tax=Psychroserpens algicola TaxID=1719034 RepID=UPI001954194B|nr:hypothetical protein [Psychroserpens algicola]
MPHLRHYFGIVLLLMLTISCSSDDDANTDEGENQNAKLIFGWFADDNCNGDCATIYKIDSSSVYRDIDSNSPEGDVFLGNFQEIPNINYQDFVVLLDELPSEIFNEPNGYLDCVDCTDALGGIYLEYQDDEVSHTWRIRNAQYPEYFANYRSLLLEKLATLNSL